MNKLYNDTAVQDIANAIRAKNGSSDTYTIAEMSTALNDLSYYAKPTISNVALATFEADGLPLNSLKVSVEAKQGGSGVPSPENIRPISGWSEVNVSDVDDVDNPTVTQTTTIALPQTVYGAEVDVVNGILTITHEIISLTNPSTKNLSKFIFRRDDNTLVENTDTQRPSSDFICDKFGMYSIQEVVSFNKVGVSISKTSGGYYVYDLNTKDMTLEQARAYYGKNPITVRYPLATPIIVPLTPTLIKSLEGINNLSVDCGEVIELEYFKEV